MRRAIFCAPFFYRYFCHICRCFMGNARSSAVFLNLNAKNYIFIFNIFCTELFNISVPRAYCLWASCPQSVLLFFRAVLPPRLALRGVRLLFFSAFSPLCKINICVRRGYPQCVKSFQQLRRFSRLCVRFRRKVRFCAFCALFQKNILHIVPVSLTLYNI